VQDRYPGSGGDNELPILASTPLPKTFAEGKRRSRQRSKMPFRLNQMLVAEARDSSDAGIFGQSKNGNSRP